MKADVALRQLEEELAAEGQRVEAGSAGRGAPAGRGSTTSDGAGAAAASAVAALPRRYHATVRLDPARVGRDASRIAEEVIAHLSGLVGSEVTVTLEIEATLPTGAPEHVVRVVLENGRTLKFTSQGFEAE